MASFFAGSVKPLLRPCLSGSSSASIVALPLSQLRSCHHKSLPHSSQLRSNSKTCSPSTPLANTLSSHPCVPYALSPTATKSSKNQQTNLQACHFSSSATTANSSDKLSTGLEYNQTQWSATYSERFPTLASGQKPDILWIGCSDSRCPETTILGLNPGDVFVHRNIANVIHESDLSSSCVIDFAVGALKVNQIVICGHTSCGGVNAALGNSKLGILDTWLLPLRKLRQQNLSTFQNLEKNEAIVKLAELNVLDGISKIKEKGVVIEAMEQRGLKVHGLIYDVATGLLRNVDAGEESQDAIKARLTAFKTA